MAARVQFNDEGPDEKPWEGSEDTPPQTSQRTGADAAPSQPQTGPHASPAAVPKSGTPTRWVCPGHKTIIVIAYRFCFVVEQVRTRCQ